LLVSIRSDKGALFINTSGSLVVNAVVGFGGLKSDSRYCPRATARLGSNKDVSL
jgi:hypothetical protein